MNRNHKLLWSSSYDICTYPYHMIKLNNDRLLERQENTLLSSAKQKDIRVFEPKVEGWQTSGQGWIYTDFKERSPLRRLTSWLRKRTSFNNGKKDRTLFVANGSGTPQEWDKIGQSDRESYPTPKYVSTYARRVGDWTI